MPRSDVVVPNHSATADEGHVSRASVAVSVEIADFVEIQAGRPAAVDEPCHVSDLHATILHLMGLDHERLTFFYKGLEERITGTRGNVVTKAIA